MPLYEFECIAGHVSTELVPMEDVDAAKEAGVPLAKRCPECGEFARKVLSATKTNFRHNDRRAFK